MNLQEKFVITIARELGTGGRTIGRKLAAELGARYCDKDLIAALVEKFGLTTYEIERIKGKKPDWLSDFIERLAPVPDASLFTGSRPVPTVSRAHPVTTGEVFQAESEILHELAEESSCVIAGRSGFFILKDHPNAVHIFIQASRENRIARVMSRQGMEEEQASVLIDSVDEGRENYIKRFSGRSRYDVRNYDLVLNVDGMTEDEAVSCILNFIQNRK